jgi:hypothetical protein
MSNRTHGLVGSEHGRVKIPVLPILVFRYFVTGKSIGAPPDNASFLYDATLDYRNKPIPKLTRARWRRVARRNACVTCPAGLTLLAFVNVVSWWAVLAWLIFVQLAGLGWLIVTVRKLAKLHNPVHALRNRKVRKEFQDPAGKLLCKLISHRYIRSRARRMIELPHGWGTGAAIDEGEETPKVARIWLPEGTVLDARLKDKIVNQVGERIGIPHPRGEWNPTGAQVFCDIQAAPRPPKQVLWTGLLPAIAKCADDEVIIGRTTGNQLVTLSSGEDSPHFGTSGPSGTGKSVLGKVFLCQRLHKGDGAFILDPKKWSHWRWAGGDKLPPDRLVYAYKTEDIHNAWIAIHAEAARRIELDEDQLDQLRRVWIVVEEINTATKRLTRYWTQERRRRMAKAKSLLKQAEAHVKESDLTLEEAADAVGLDMDELDLPATSPAVVAMQESVGMGRELKMHVLVMAQRLSASVFGGNGGDIRESFQSGIMIARWNRKLWKMLIDTIPYMACPTGTRGIWGLVRGEDFTIFRVPLITDKEATAFALAGAPATGPVLGPQEHAGTIAGTCSEQAAITSAVTLTAALGLLPGQDGPAAITDAAIRRAAQRAGFPEALPKLDGSPYGAREARLYDLADLVEWQECRLAMAKP